MWPFKKRNNSETEKTTQKENTNTATVADGIDWQQILSEGKPVEIFDGCKANCDGIFGDV